MTSFKERMAALKAAKESAKQQAEPVQKPVQKQAEQSSLLQRMQAYNAQMNQLSAVLNNSFKAPVINPYEHEVLFKDSAPDSMDDVAALMIAAYGFDGALEQAELHQESCLNEGESELANNWFMVAEIIEQAAEAQVIAEKTVSVQLAEPDELAPEPEPEETVQPAGTGQSFALNIQLNEKQQAARDMAFAGKSFCLIGPAGSGKTTGQRSVAAALYDSGMLETTQFKVQGAGSYVAAPSIAFVAFTRRAAGNLRKAIHKDPHLAEVFQNNIMTIHSLLEYEPEYYFDSLEMKNKFRFAPKRTANNPLTITHLVIEEASMVGAYDLWMKLYDALPEGIQIIFIGDINQLPPVFGPSILNYALIQLPIVELTEVYRNQGMVLENAHRILKGEVPIEADLCKVIRGNRPVQIPQETMGNRQIPMLFKTMFNTQMEDGTRMYDPDYDIILTPFNVQAMGTINVNKWISQFVGEARGAVVHEVIASFNKLYLAVGDKVMVNKLDGVIVDIVPNPQYAGRDAQLPGADLSRFGFRIQGKDSNLADLLDEPHDGGEISYTNFNLESLAEQEAERKQQASHIVTVEYENGFKESLSAAGDFSEAAFTLGYCLTTHKAQGSEWRQVYILMHKDQSTMLFREWFYTAYTRARIGVTVIGKDFLIEKTVKSPRIKGNTLKDKLAYFNSGINSVVDVQCLKG